MSVYLENYQTFRPCSIEEAARRSNSSESEIQDILLDFVNQVGENEFEGLAISPENELILFTNQRAFVWVGDGDFELIENSAKVVPFLTGFNANKIKKALVNLGLPPRDITRRIDKKKHRDILRVSSPAFWRTIGILQDKGVFSRKEEVKLQISITKRTLKELVQRIAEKYQMNVTVGFGDELGKKGYQQDEMLYVIIE